MTIIRGLAAAVILAGASLGVASPAEADEVAQGVYTYVQEGKPPSTWTIFPICVPTVGDLREPLYLPVACTLHVASSSGRAGDAQLTGGRWTFTLKDPEGVACADGSKAEATENYAFDGNTLAGQLTTLHNPVCGLPAGMTKEPFILVFKEPLPIPVDRYPLICEPGGLRRCF